MFVHPKTLTMATVAALAAGFSAVLISAAPASATPFSCGLGGTDLGGGVCQLTYTAGTASFVPVVGTSKLEALLVGGGGSGNSGYAGGGGEVTLVNFSDTSTEIDVVVGDPGNPSSVTQGSSVSTANPGEDGGGSGGASGNGNTGWPGGIDADGAAGGAGGSPANEDTGGQGQIVSALASSTSLFATDSNCYGGGGAIEDYADNYGAATCGGGYEQDQPGNSAQDTPVAIAPAANSGGGGGTSAPVQDSNSGAAGLVVIRWVAATPVTVNFVLNGHGSPIPDQIVASGTEAVQPSDPSATGFIFNGWYSDAGLTAKANFSTPILVNTTFYASWSSVPAVAAPLTVNFVLNGHGSPIPDQSVASGAEATQPTDPSAAGFTFNGWYSNPALTTKADFTAPILVNTTFYASWRTPSALALTGVGVEPWVIPGAVGALLVGLVVVVVSRRRRGLPIS